MIEEFQKEHENTLRELSALDSISNQIQGNDDFEKNKGELKKTSEHFKQIQKHFEKEEIILDKLEEKGVKGPVEVMREEHEEIREEENKFNELTNKSALSDEEIKKLKHVIRYLIEMFKSHIQKEEMILYPLVLERLSEEEFTECEDKSKKLK
jgi:DUF438 domain-containing protein